MDGAVPRHLIWIVEDDDDVRDSVSMLLTAAGFDVVAFVNGAAAWTAIEDGDARPAAIVLDNHMPQMDGLEFRRRQLARRDVAAIPVIVFTASGPIVVSGALVVSKSTNAEILVSALRRACTDRDHERRLTLRAPRTAPAPAAVGKLARNG